MFITSAKQKILKAKNIQWIVSFTVTACTVTAHMQTSLAVS